MSERKQKVDDLVKRLRWAIDSVGEIKKERVSSWPHSSLYSDDDLFRYVSSMDNIIEELADMALGEIGNE